MASPSLLLHVSQSPHDDWKVPSVVSHVEAPVKRLTYTSCATTPTFLMAAFLAATESDPASSRHAWTSSSLRTACGFVTLAVTAQEPVQDAMMSSCWTSDKSENLRPTASRSSKMDSHRTSTSCVSAA